MAFASHMAGLLRRVLPQPPLLRTAPASIAIKYGSSIRCMSSSKLFIGGISWGTDEETLREAFSSYGVVTDAKIILDRDTGRSRGFGFVSFTTDEDAKAALQAMDGRELGGRTIRVDYATERSSGFGGASVGGSSRGFGGDFGAGDRGRVENTSSFGNIGSEEGTLGKSTDDRWKAF